MVAEAGVWACYLRAAGTILWFEFSGFPQHNVVDNTAKMHLGVVVVVDGGGGGGGESGVWGWGEGGGGTI